MPLYGHQNDISFFRKVNRELISRIISQEVVYYIIAPGETKTNAYGEASSATGKFYYPGVLLNLLRAPDPQITNDGDVGPDQAQSIQFRFLRDDLVDISLVPQVGDIIMWKEEYFEVDNYIENQFIMGKDNNYALSDATQNFGESWSILCNTHHSRPTKLNITQARL